jgi:hypothetical protein
MRAFRGLGAPVSECVENCNVIWSSVEEQDKCKKACGLQAAAKNVEPALAAFGAGGQQIAKWGLLAAGLLAVVPFLKRSIAK